MYSKGPLRDLLVTHGDPVRLIKLLIQKYQSYVADWRLI